MRTTTERGYGAQHQATSRRMRAEHVARFGWVCPGIEAYGEGLHPSMDLVADHNVPGHPEHGYTVRCRRHNQQTAHGGRLR